jgi:hypothetical protein
MSAPNQSFESVAFKPFHESELPRRIAAAPAPIPSDYAKTLRSLGISIKDTSESYTYSVADGAMNFVPGSEDAATLIELDRSTWEELTHDLESSAGMIYHGKVTCLRGDVMQLMQWEPTLRWAYRGRPIYDPEAVDLRDRNGTPLDPGQSFELEDDREEMAHFLRTVGYLWIRNVFSAAEVTELQVESERLRADAREGDQESWWGKNASGESLLCRVLRAGKEPKMRSLHGDARILGLAELCDAKMVLKQSAESKDGVAVLWKQPGVEEGLGDLPWHRDCGMGGHESMCPTAVVSIFLGPNTPEAGAIRFLPGSWKTSLAFAEAGDPRAPEGVIPAAGPGDVTIHYGDGLHVAPPPTRTTGPFRTCILMGFQREDGWNHRGGRHYNDVLLGNEDGQVEHMTKIAGRSQPGDPDS